MGVHGLWKLIEPAGKPVPVETLENKILAVDVSIWLHQLVKGYQDSGGGTVANAHLLGLFHRICKLLYFKVKPIFVFDGGVPVLKKQTIAARRTQRSKADEVAAKLREQILKNLIQQRAVGHAAGTVPAGVPSHLLSQREDDMFELPPAPSTSKEAEEEEEDEEEDYKPVFSTHQLQKIDVNSKEFKALPPDIRHDILSELKEFRKQNSWNRIAEMPDSLDDFSGFQLGRLMKRRNIQVSLEEAAQEMGGRTLSLGEMQKMFEEDGIITDAEVTQRIASDSKTRFVYIPGGKIPAEMLLNEPGPSTSKKDDYEEDVKEPQLPLKKEEDPEVIKMIEEIEDEFADESDEDYISMRSESPEPKIAQNNSDDEITQAEIYKILQETSAAGHSSQSSSQKGAKPDEPLSAVENELQKIFSADAQGQEEQKDKLKSKENCDNDVLNVSDDVASDYHGSKAKLNGQIPSSSNTSVSDEMRQKPSTSSQGNDPSRKNTKIPKKNCSRSDLASSFNSLKSPKKERMSVESPDYDSGSNDYMDVTEENFESGNLVKQFAKISKEAPVNISQAEVVPGKSIYLSPKKEMMSPKKEMISPKKERVVAEMTDSVSSSDEFLEVEEQSQMNAYYQKAKLDEFVAESIRKEKEKPCFEIVIEPSKCKVDSLFADVFTTEVPSNAGHGSKAEVNTSGLKHSRTSLPEINSVPNKALEVSLPKSEIVSTIVTDSFTANRSEKSNLGSTEVNVSDEDTEKLPTTVNSPTAKNIESDEENHSTTNGASSDVSVTPEDDTSAKAQMVENEEVNNADISSEPVDASKSDPVKTGTITEDGGSKSKPNSEQDMLSQLNVLARKNYATTPQKKKPVPSPSKENPPSGSANQASSSENEDMVPISEYTESPSKQGTGDATSDESNDEGTKDESLSQYFDPETLKNLQSELEMERDKLLIERGKQERLASSITDQMNLDAQELLKIFGIPYIIAPMEAEAQCAFLDSTMLTDGTITDDSDIWLFGGRKVYKNFFDQKKHVLSFRIAEITHFFKLTRAQLIQLALLVGSDYTPGLKGVGPVTALEILSFFKDSSEEAESRRVILAGLEKFKEWLKKPENIRAQCVFANKIKNLTIHEGFPNPAVVDAYLQPEIDDSNEGFSWGSPDLKALEDFVWAKFGWTKSKLDHLLNPVLKRISERTNQTSIDRFFQSVPRSSHDRGIKSKRVKRAIGQLSGEVDPDEPLPTTSKRKKKKNEGPAPTVADNEEGARGTAERVGTTETTGTPGTVGAAGRGEAPETAVESGTAGMLHSEGTAFNQRRKTVTPRNPQATRKRPSASTLETTIRPSTSQLLPEETVEFEEKNKTEFIPQREKDNIEKLKRKMKAVEIFTASKKNQRGKRRKPNMRRKGKIETSSYFLSESSDSD